MRVARGLVLTVVNGLAASALAACGGGCRGFSYSLASDAEGEPTPAAAVRQWAEHGDEGAPAGDWTPGPDRNGFRSFVNGDWSVTVVPVPAGGWLVDAGQTCRD